MVTVTVNVRRIVRSPGVQRVIGELFQLQKTKYQVYTYNLPRAPGVV